jgi:hypothetical protein
MQEIDSARVAAELQHAVERGQRISHGYFHCLCPRPLMLGVRRLSCAGDMLGSENRV